jgi:hypothetical protein
MIVVIDASAGGAVDFSWLDENLIHVASATAKVTTSTVPTVLRIQPSRSDWLDVPFAQREPSSQRAGYAWRSPVAI